MLNLSVFLEQSTREHPDRTAIIFNDAKYTYAQVNAMANQVAGGLQSLGLGIGDKVALSCPNLPFFPMVYYGILKAGCTVVPLNVLLKPREIAYHLNDSDAKAYFAFEGTADLPMGEMAAAGFNEIAGCEHLFIMTMDQSAQVDQGQTIWQLMADQSPEFETVSTSPLDTAVILYTSGTTGQPKGAELTHSNMIMNGKLAETMYPRTEKPDVHLITLPLFHSYGQTAQLNAGFYTGSTLSLLPRFDPDTALSIIDRDDVTIFMGVPTMFWAILNHPNAEKYDLEKIAKNMRVACSGGAAIPVEVMKDFEEKYNVPIMEGYGLSETSPLATFNPYFGTRKAGSIGLPVWGVNVRIFDPEDNEVPRGEKGEIVIKGHNVMKGYYKRPEATEKVMGNGWFHTGDVGMMDEDGYLYITDRVKDMIIRGGFNVYPREIEEVMMTHPAISLCTVIGIPHDSHGEEIKAFVVKHEGNDDVTAEVLVEWCKEEMAAYKYPRHVEFMDALPMTATGKILKRELRQ